MFGFLLFFFPSPFFVHLLSDKRNSADSPLNGCNIGYKNPQQTEVEVEPELSSTHNHTLPATWHVSPAHVTVYVYGVFSADTHSIPAP